MKSILILTMMLVPSLAYSAPVINTVAGNITAGQQITISGSGFGANGPHVVLFDDFSQGSVGSVHPTTAVVGNWSKAMCIVYADPMLSNGRGARCVGSSGQLTSVVTFPTTQEVFVSSYAYVPSGYKFPYSDSPHSFPSISAMKHFWLMYGSNGYSNTSEPDIYGPNWTGAVWYRITSNDTPMAGFDTNHEVAWAWDEPVRWTLWAKGNNDSISGTDGMFQGVSSSGHVEKSYTNYKAWFDSSYPVKGWNQLNIIGYTRSGASFNNGDNWVIDDVYVATGANAAARIEIGNAPTYSSCTKLALFTPDTWSDNTITATVRQGHFSNGASAYLYVIDANGNANNSGIPITLGTGSNSQILLPPPNVKTN